MIRSILSLFILLNIAWSQDHWETAVFAGDDWHYFIGNQEPPSDWMTIPFDDSVWLVGPGGIGYGDSDDATIIPSCSALYLRKSFQIIDTNILEAALLHFDYDDGFIAYLNGAEIHRSPNMGNPGSFVGHNAGTSAGHEAVGYQGLPMEMQVIDALLVQNTLQNGENVLAIQVQNTSTSSSDLTGLFWLTFGISDASNPFSPVPDWFIAPFLFTSSLLPIIIIDTQGQSIPNEPKIHAFMGVIDNGPGQANHLTDPFTGYDGHIGIEVRGASSQMYAKKQYAMETRDNLGDDLKVELLGFPEESDWILHAPYSDKTLLRNALVYTLARETGNYASRTKYFELVLNGIYQGVYVLMEKIKRDSNRIDIAKLDPDEIDGDDLTGGYIIKVDKWAGVETDRWFSEPGLPGYGGVYYQYHYPKYADIADEQIAYIQNYMSDFERMFADGSYLDPVEGYYDKIDWDQFLDYAIMQEFAKNVDGFRLSSFIYKDKDSNDDRLHTGPVWDFNLAFGNANYYDGGNPIGWYFDTDFQGDPWAIPFWWYLIWDDVTFKSAFNMRWQELRQNVLSQEHIMTLVDSMVAEMGAARDRNFEVWPVLNEWVWPNAYVGGTYENELNFLKDWITSRLDWMDTQTGWTDIEAPENFQVTHAFPNPFNPNQTLRFRVESPGHLQVSIINIQGRQIKSLITKAGENGMVELIWDGTDQRSNDLPSGVYFIVPQTGSIQPVFKATLLR
ncbi:MAG: CotH kinase family protein [Candidatus Marinimicrobia bacterium]|nr:CotH kinase family protein [Candidatus Neomarinimicrobiota bacterium]